MTANRSEDPAIVEHVAGTTSARDAAFIWVYFGRLYLIHDLGEWRIANQQLGYPFYFIFLIGVTHILGGAGLLISKVPRLIEWV